MGGALFQVDVDRVDGRTVDLRVTAVHPDAGPPPEGIIFAFSILVDACIGFEYAKDEAVMSSALAAEVSTEDYLDEDFMETQPRGFLDDVQTVERRAGLPLPDSSDSGAWDAYWGGLQGPQVRCAAWVGAVPA